MRIFVTGGAGFIGSNLVDELLKLGNFVACYDNFDNFYSRNRKEQNINKSLNNINYQLFEGDIRNKYQLDACIKSFRPEIIIHLAAKAGVQPSIQEPSEYFDVNVVGTINILETMKSNNIFKMIFASSSSVYGNTRKIPFKENTCVDYPISQYAASKKSAELLCHTYHHLYGFQIYCLRFFTAYGPRQRPDLAIYKFTNQILNNKPLKIYGSGRTSRDYTYISDIVSGIINSIKYLKGYEIINIGASRKTSLLKLITTIENSLGQKAIVEKIPSQPGDVLVTFADISKAKQLIDYKPITPLNVGIKLFIEWLKQQ